ncbi:MAG: ferrochelatase [Pseudoxanthomonas sp.]
MPNAKETALLIVNLGTPAEPTPKAVRRYLAEFLGDPRVVSIPRLLWLPLLHGLVLPLRAARSAEKYAKVWLPQGSPLAVYTQRLAEAVQARLPHWHVLHAMRYGEPALAPALQQLRELRAQEIVLLPLYPQYSTTTTASVIDRVRALAGGLNLRIIDDYSCDPGWIATVADSIRDWRAQHGAGEQLLFSFHGLPQRVADNGDPYPQRCETSAAAIAAALGLRRDEWTLCYQSRFGRERWLEPSTDATLSALASRRVRKVDVVCPGFATDCLETLEEVAMFYAQGYEKLGGQLRYIPCLNDSPAHADALAALALRARV